MYVLKQMVDKRLEVQGSRTLGFVDLENAFDIVPIEMVSSSGEHFSSRTLITDYGSEVFEVVYCFQLLPLYRDVSL